MLDDLELPSGVSLVRTTRLFTAETVPPALLKAHHVATGVWGLLRVSRGSVVFVTETGGDRRAVLAGETQVIEPETPHHVEPTMDAEFLVEFYR